MKRLYLVLDQIDLAVKHQFIPTLRSLFTVAEADDKNDVRVEEGVVETSTTSR
jgi:hypothetical protein